MSGLANIVKLFPNYINLISNRNFIRYVTQDYYFLIILLVLVIGFYLKHREYKKLTLVIFFLFGYLFLVNVSYPQGTNQYYIENQYLILTVFLSIPFGIDIFPSIKNTYKWLAITACMIICLTRIYNAHKLYTARLNWYRDMLTNTSVLEKQKLIITEDKVPMDILMMTWSSSFEFWLLSTIEQNKSRSIIIVGDRNEITWQQGYNNAFITKWGIDEYDKLDQNYFKFTDTSYYNYYEK